MLNKIYRFILFRRAFKGQFKLFLWLFHRNKFKNIETVSRPLNDEFSIIINTRNYIEASIYFTGDYENYVKKVFKTYIRSGDVVMDVGANIGFHTLYFAQLVGSSGRVYAFEPMPVNFNSLVQNIELNNYVNVVPVNKALGSENKHLNIHLDAEQVNPGAYNLFGDGPKNTEIEISTGDKFLSTEKVKTVNFIKIDVEGFELPVFLGLMETINKFKPTIVFEFDRNYQLLARNKSDEIFNLLKKANYSFHLITVKGLEIYDSLKCEISGNILALPIN